MKVAIFFGSKSDKETMKKAADVLTEFGVEYKAFIISAHRAGPLLVKTIKEVEADGFEVIIAGAGLAAALPGAAFEQFIAHANPRSRQLWGTFLCSMASI